MKVIYYFKRQSSSYWVTDLVNVKISVPMTSILVIGAEASVFVRLGLGDNL